MPHLSYSQGSYLIVCAPRGQVSVRAQASYPRLANASPQRSVDAKSVLFFPSISQTIRKMAGNRLDFLSFESIVMDEKHNTNSFFERKGLGKWLT